MVCVVCVCVCSVTVVGDFQQVLHWHQCQPLIPPYILLHVNHCQLPIPNILFARAHNCNSWQDNERNVSSLHRAQLSIHIPKLPCWDAICSQTTPAFQLEHCHGLDYHKIIVGTIAYLIRNLVYHTDGWVPEIFMHKWFFFVSLESFALREW